MPGSTGNKKQNGLDIIVVVVVVVCGSFMAQIGQRDFKGGAWSPSKCSWRQFKLLNCKARRVECVEFCGDPGRDTIQNLLTIRGPIPPYLTIQSHTIPYHLIPIFRREALVLLELPKQKRSPPRVLGVEIHFCSPFIYNKLQPKNNATLTLTISVGPGPTQGYGLDNADSR